MCRRRRNPSTRRTTVHRLVREAETVVHNAWLTQLRERRQEMEAALGRATARCDTAQDSLTAAQHSGDPRQIAIAHSDLEKALEATRKAALAWDRVRHVLSIEAGLPTAAPGSALTLGDSCPDSAGTAVPMSADRDADRSLPQTRAADGSARHPSRFARWSRHALALLSRRDSVNVTR